MMINLSEIWKNNPVYKDFSIKLISGIKINCVGEYQRIFYILNRLFLNAGYLSKEKMLIQVSIVSEKALRKLQGNFCCMLEK